MAFNYTIFEVIITNGINCKCSDLLWTDEKTQSKVETDEA